MTEIKDRLQEALTMRQWTAADLSKKSGINKGSISKYLKGSVIPKQSAIGVMAQALGVSPAWLLGFDDKQEDATIKMDIEALSDSNKARLLAYYEGLLASQGEDHGDT